MTYKELDEIKISEKKMGNYLLGEIKEKFRKDITLDGDRITVWKKVFSSGKFRVGAYLFDRSRSGLLDENHKLRKEVLDLKQKLKGESK